MVLRFEPEQAGLGAVLGWTAAFVTPTSALASLTASAAAIIAAQAPTTLTAVAT